MPLSPNGIHILELAGLPASGKTTTATLLHDLCHSQGINCTIIPEAAAQSPLSHLKRDWRFNASTMLHAILGLLEVNIDRTPAVVVLDRGLFDVLCWLRWFKRSHSIPHYVFDTLNSLVLIDEWFGKLDSIIVLRTSYETALKRRGETGRIVNPKTMSELRQAYDEVLSEWMGQLPKSKLHFLDTDLLPPNQVLTLTANIIGLQHAH